MRPSLLVYSTLVLPLSQVLFSLVPVRSSPIISCSERMPLICLNPFFRALSAPLSHCRRSPDSHVPPADVSPSLCALFPSQNILQRPLLPLLPRRYLRPVFCSTARSVEQERERGDGRIEAELEERCGEDRGRCQNWVEES